MPFYIYEISKKIVEAKTRDEARQKLGITHKDTINFLNLATEKDMIAYPMDTGERQVVEKFTGRALR
jgi:hypothetical protein